MIFDAILALYTDDCINAFKAAGLKDPFSLVTVAGAELSLGHPVWPWILVTMATWVFPTKPAEKFLVSSEIVRRERSPLEANSQVMEDRGCF